MYFVCKVTFPKDLLVHSMVRYYDEPYTGVIGHVLENEFWCTSPDLINELGDPSLHYDASIPGEDRAALLRYIDFYLPRCTAEIVGLDEEQWQRMESKGPWTCERALRKMKHSSDCYRHEDYILAEDSSGYFALSDRDEQLVWFADLAKAKECFASHCDKLVESMTEGSEFGPSEDKINDALDEIILYEDVGDGFKEIPMCRPYVDFAIEMLSTYGCRDDEEID